MAGMSDVRDIVRGVLASMFGFGGRLVARAILMIVAARAYGMEALGLLGIVAATTEIVAGIGVLGLKRGLLDFLSYDEERGRAPQSRILEAFGLGLSVTLLAVVVVTCALTLFWPDLTKLAPIILITAPMIVVSEIALTAIKFKRVIGWDVAIRGAIEPWGFVLLAFLFLQVDNIQSGLLWAYVGSFAISAVFAVIGVLRIYGPKTFLQAQPQFSELMNIPKRSTSVGIADLGFLAFRRVDLIVLSAFVSAEAVGLYYAVQQIATIPQRIYSLFEPMMSPVIARLHNRMDAKRIKSTLIGVCRWVLIIQLAVTVPMVVYGDHLLHIFGPSYAIGAGVLAVVLIGELVDGSFMAVETPLLFARPKIPPILIIGALLIEVISIAALAPTMGVYGAGFGFFFAMLALSIGRLVMIHRHLLITVVNPSYFAPVIFSLGLAAVLTYTRRWISPGDGALIVLLFIMSISTYLSLVRKFALTSSDRVIMRAIFKRRKPSIS